MKLIAIKELFNPIYGVNLELLNMEVCDKRDIGSIRFISRKESNNGLVAYVKKVDNIAANPAHTISVAVSGSVLSSFYQDKEYYSGRDIYYLLPKKKMSVEEMLFYAFCLQANKYKYNYGRGANRTLKNILVPAEIPKSFSTATVKSIELPDSSPLLQSTLELNVEEWQPFELQDIFIIKKGKRLTKEDMEVGNTPFIAAIDSNNGYRDFISREPIHSGNTITVNYNGSVAESFYQPVPFWASDDVNVLYPKSKMSVYVALFVATIIENEKYRYNFGRKWHKARMERSSISLPAKDGKPDFKFMEHYIKSLPYAAAISEGGNEFIVKAAPAIKKAKALSDDELIEKYETGEVDIQEMVKKILKSTPVKVKQRK